MEQGSPENKLSRAATGKSEYSRRVHGRHHPQPFPREHGLAEAIGIHPDECICSHLAAHSAGLHCGLCYMGKRQG